VTVKIGGVTVRMSHEEGQPVKKVIIVGGGFAGINAAKTLGDKKDVSVVLIDRRNHHLFQPLLYQVAMAGLSPAEIAYPIRSMLTGYKNIEVLLGNVTSIDTKSRKIQTDFGSMDYDYLILACGSKHSYFGHPEWEEFAPGLKNLEQATEIRRRVLTAFELAEREANQEKRRQLLTFIIVGGGPTGVELAGALGEITRFTLGKDFEHIDPSTTRIILIEGGSRILATFAPELSKRAHRDLENLGVTIWTERTVTRVSAEGVNIGDEFIKASTILWAAGVQPSSLNKTLGVELDKQGRVVIEKDLSLRNLPEVFVLGDQAHFESDKGPLPGLAPVAMQQGLHASRNILRDLRGDVRKPFEYFDKGQMATIGRKKAVAQFRNFKFKGLLAWLAWLFIHVYYLIGFKNRLIVLINWFWSYATYQKGARLIVSKDWHSYLNASRLTKGPVPSQPEFVVLTKAPEKVPDTKQ
jgi:NADH dehydrogenase